MNIKPLQDLMMSYSNMIATNTYDFQAGKAHFTNSLSAKLSAEMTHNTNFSANIKTTHDWLTNGQCDEMIVQKVQIYNPKHKALDYSRYLNVMKTEAINMIKPLIGVALFFGVGALVLRSVLKSPAAKDSPLA